MPSCVFWLTVKIIVAVVCIDIISTVCVCVYLVVHPDVSDENGEVIQAKRHIIVHILVQPLLGWAGVTIETHTHTNTLFVATYDNDHHTHTHSSTSVQQSQLKSPLTDTIFNIKRLENRLSFATRADCNETRTSEFFKQDFIHFSGNSHWHLRSF